MDSREAKDALSAWKIGRITSWDEARMGEVNRNFIINTARGKYVLRQILSHSHYEEPGDLKFEFSYLSQLKSAGFPYQVPSALPTGSGGQFVKLRGRYYWLYEFIEGTVLDSFNRTHFDALAKMMGTYHGLLEELHPHNGKQPTDVFSRDQTMEEMESVRSKLANEQPEAPADTVFREESANLITLLSGLDEGPYLSLGRYPIHRDIIPENLIWRKKKLVGLIDFEHVSSNNEPTVKDIAVTLQF